MFRPGNSCCGNEAGLVQKFIGSAYDVVKNVHDNLEEIKFIFDFMAKYDVLLCVESLDELKQVNWKSSKFVRWYVIGKGANTYTDYIYDDSDKSGVLPDDPRATGSWVKVNTFLGTGASNAIPWLYNKGSANGGEVNIHVEEDAIGVSEIFINGLRKHLGIGYTYEPVSRTIQLPTALAKGDQLVAKLIGYPALPNTPNISEFMFVNWVYNNGISIGGETKLKPPYTFQKVPAVFINGLRKLENHDYVVGYSDYSINLTLPLKTNDVVIVQLGGEADAFSIDTYTAREALRRTYAEAGLVLVGGSFEDGAKITTKQDVVLERKTGKCYSWGGDIPSEGKIIPVGSTPSTTGGIGHDKWVIEISSTLRELLARDGGAGLVGGLAKPVTWSGFAGGADNTGANASDAAFIAANATKRMIYVPSGTYLLNNDIISDKDTTWRFEQDVTFVGAGKLRQVPWLLGLGGNIFHYLERTSRNTFIAPGDGTAVFGSAHTIDGGAGGAALAVAGMAYNDDTSGSRSSVWGHYSTVVREATAIGASHGMEIDIANLGTNAEMFPASMFPNGQTDALWLASGGELTEAGVSVGNASAAIGVISNDKASNARFLKGIIFQNKSLVGTDGGSTGQAIAIAMANRHSLTWYNNSNQKTTEILSTSEDNSKALRLNFSDFGASFQRTSGGKPVFNIETGASTPANYLTMRYGSAGNPVTVAAAGDDANIDIMLSPKGAGAVAVGGNMPPQTANTYTVGTALRPWAGGFTQTAFTVTSDENYKTKALEITDAMLDAAAEVEWCMFQYLDRVEVKGEDSARWHFGAMAQQFVRAFEKYGLDPLRFAFICYDEWESSPEIIDDDGVVIFPAVDAGSRYGIRYDQAIILKQMQIERDHKRQIGEIEARLILIEAKLKGIPDGV